MTVQATISKYKYSAYLYTNSIYIRHSSTISVTLTLLCMGQALNPRGNKSVRYAYCYYACMTFKLQIHQALIELAMSDSQI